ncbi:hypothetical protein MMC21_002982 [Puttea exsequens]|nr:hypothetical protein [Puttea exsequens]
MSNTSSHSLLSPTTGHRPPSTFYSNSTPTSPTTPRTLYHNNEITPPAPPRELIRLSEIIDPRDLLAYEAQLRAQYHDASPTPSPSPSNNHAAQRPSQLLIEPPQLPRAGRAMAIVQSPSGNALGAEEFIRHPGRPLAMWERRERVVSATRERVEMESRAGMRSRASVGRGDEGGSGETGERGRRRGRGCCGFW